jgi:hypothetical protein
VNAREGDETVRCEDVRRRLDDRAEGTLGEAEGRAVEAHLEGCPACREEAAGLEALLEAAADLPREIRPPRDLWAGIDARLDAAETDAPDPPPIPFRAPRRPAGLPPWALVAAALALVVVTAGVTSFLTRRHDEAMALKLGRARTAPATVEDAAGPATREAQLLAASQDLLAGLESQDLSPETMEIVRRNLAVIDAAIAELHAALERDPGNGELNRMLLATYQRKIDLLEQAARSGEG